MYVYSHVHFENSILNHLNLSERLDCQIITWIIIIIIILYYRLAEHINRYMTVVQYIVSSTTTD